MTMRLQRRGTGYFLTAIAAAAIAGCAATGQPFHGKLIQSDETFNGTASQEDNAHGTVVLKSSRGVTCSGTYRYITLGNALDKYGGVMDFSCTDGRKGGVILTGNKDMSGVGTVGENILLLGD